MKTMLGREWVPSMRMEVEMTRAKGRAGPQLREDGHMPDRGDRDPVRFPHRKAEQESGVLSRPTQDRPNDNNTNHHLSAPGGLGAPRRPV